jgi:hypothetical protein
MDRVTSQPKNFEAIFSVRLPVLHLHLKIPGNAAVADILDSVTSVYLKNGVAFFDTKYQVDIEPSDPLTSKLIIYGKR